MQRRLEGWKATLGSEFLSKASEAHPDSTAVRTFVNTEAQTGLQPSKRLRQDKSEFHSLVEQFVLKETDPLLQLSTPVYGVRDAISAVFAAGFPQLDRHLSDCDEYERRHPTERPHVKVAEKEQDVRIADLVRGRVTGIHDFGISVQLHTIVTHPSIKGWREIPMSSHDRRMQAFCQLNELPIFGDDTTQSPQSFVESGENVLGFVTAIDDKHERILLSFNSARLPESLKGVTLGVFRGRSSMAPDITKVPFTEVLREHRIFRQPNSWQKLKNLFQLDSSQTFVPNTPKEFPPQDYREYLRRKQDEELSMACVSKGVRLHKVGKHKEAIACYDKALGVNKGNVEAYVARGASFSTGGEHGKALQDFQKALSLKPDHGNAKKYLEITLLRRASTYERTAKVEHAMEDYEQVAKLNGEKLQEAQAGIERLQNVLRRREAMQQSQQRAAQAMFGGATFSNQQPQKTAATSAPDFSTVRKLLDPKKHKRKRDKKKKKEKKHKKKSKSKKSRYHGSEGDSSSDGSS